MTIDMREYKVKKLSAAIDALEEFDYGAALDFIAGKRDVDTDLLRKQMKVIDEGKRLIHMD